MFVWRAAERVYGTTKFCDYDIFGDGDCRRDDEGHLTNIKFQCTLTISKEISLLLNIIYYNSCFEVYQIVLERRSY